jgi:hypothetical protein
LQFQSNDFTVISSVFFVVFILEETGIAYTDGFHLTPCMEQIDSQRVALRDLLQIIGYSWDCFRLKLRRGYYTLMGVAILLFVEFCESNWQCCYLSLV